MKRSLLLVGMTLLAVGCIQKKNSASTVKHDVGKPFNDASESRQWRQVSSEEYRKILSGGLQAIGPFLPSTDPRVVRAQYWLDKIDAMLRDAHKDMKNIPKPEAVVIDSKDVNAFVASVPICIDLSFKGNSGKDVKAVAFRRNEMKIEEFTKECMPSNMDAKDQKEFLTWWVKSFDGCDLKVDNSGVTAAGAGCEKYGAIGSASQIVLFQTSSKVGFFSDIFSRMTEGEFVSVIAHELGHYYKSHISSASHDYNFFYTMNANHPAGRPKADESLRAFGEEVLKVSKERMPTGEDLDASDLAVRAKIITTMGKAIKMNLAQYTVEQEADELALEWMSKVGVDASYAVEGQFALAEIVAGRSKSGPEGWISGTDCKTSYEKGWKNEKGEAVMVPVADWEIHHSPCFRAFNMDREIKAHKYPQQKKPLHAPAPAWDSFKKAALIPTEL